MQVVDSGHPAKSAYELLLAKLAYYQTLASAGQDELEIAGSALSDVIAFLQNDPVANAPDLWGPLQNLFVNVHDLVQGGKPALFFNRPERKNQTKPTNLFEEVGRGQIAFALDFVIRAGMKPGEAVSWLTREVSRRRIVHTSGGAMTADQIARWRHQISDGSAPDARKAMFEQLREDYPALPGQTERAKRQAVILLDTVRRLNFPKSPSHNGNG